MRRAPQTPGLNRTGPAGGFIPREDVGDVSGFSGKSHSESRQIDSARRFRLPTVHTSDARRAASIDQAVDDGLKNLAHPSAGEGHGWLILILLHDRLGPPLDFPRRPVPSSRWLAVCDSAQPGGECCPDLRFRGDPPCSTLRTVPGSSPRCSARATCESPSATRQDRRRPASVPVSTSPG